jgi:hypothetical protein
MKKLLLSIFAIGVLSSVNAQTLLNEDFNYTVGDSVGTPSLSKGWGVISGVYTNMFTVVSPGLTYTGYSGSGVGNATSLTTSGQDIYKDASASITSGSVYASLMLNVSAAQATGDYFFGMLPTSSTSTFFARLFVKLSSTGYYRVGISKSSVGALEAATYSSDSFSFNNTYLAVIKYQYNTGTNDDSVKVYMLSSGVPALEPAVPTVQNLGAIGAGNADATTLGRVFLRQGSASNAATLKVDGIKFSSSWASSSLPVQYKSIIATRNSGNSVVKWSTASEKNNKGFEVQRSINGGKYLPIAFVAGAANSSVAKNYVYIDFDNNTGNVCYRLKQIDMNGVSELSKVVCVTIEATKTNNELVTSPNPFNGSLVVKYHSINEGNITIQLIDMLGKTHQEVVETVTKGDNQITLNTDAMPLGIYFIRIANGNDITTQRIVKR